MNFSLTGNGVNVTFSLPSTVTPSSVTGGAAHFNDIVGTLIGTNKLVFGTIDLELSGYGGATDYWAFGSTGHVDPWTQHYYAGPEVWLVAPGLFKFNSDGSVTIETGTWTLGASENHLGEYTLTVVDPPAPTESTPEPASLALLATGGLALAGLRRRKSA
jgi:hypothetical protein